MDLRNVPAPDLEDPVFRPYWQGAAQGKLMLPRCRGCGRMNWPPRAICLECRASDFTWEQHRPSGTLFSWTVVGRATAPGYVDVPYTVGIIALDDVPVRLMGQVVGVDPKNVAMGMRLSARFTTAGSSPEFTVIQFEPNPTSPGDANVRT